MSDALLTPNQQRQSTEGKEEPEEAEEETPPSVYKAAVLQATAKNLTNSNISRYK